MRNFCVDEFWNSELSWNNTWPQLTDCFQSGLLLPLPCVYLWLFLPFHLYYLYQKADNNYRAVRSIFILKVVFCTIAMTSALADLILDVSLFTSYIPSSLILAGSFKLFSYVVATFTIFVEYRKRAFHSLGLLVFYILLMLTHIVPFYSNIMLQKCSSQEGSCLLFYTEYAAILVLVVLHCFNSSTPRNKVNMSPEETASILSMLTVWWSTGLVLHGYKNLLTEDDVYPLNRSERASTVMPAFLQNWSIFLKQTNLKQRKGSRHKLQTRGAKYMKYPEVNLNDHPPFLSSEETQNQCKVENENEKSILTGLHSQPSEKKDRSQGFFLWKVLLYTFRKQLIRCCLIEMVVLTCSLSKPMIIKLMIDFVSRSEEQDWHGYFLAVILFVTSALGHLLYEFFYFQTNKFGIRVKTALFSAIYRKSLCLSSQAKQQCSSGEVIHLLSKDCDAIGTLADEGFALVEFPIELVVGVVLVYHTVGVAMFAGLVTMGALFVVKAITARKHSQCDQKLKENADQRMKILSQVFSGIKVLKLYAWEEAFLGRIRDIRKHELSAIFKYDLFRFFITFAWTGAIFWMIFFTFLTYIYVDEKHFLSSSTVFVTMAYFIYIRRSCNCLASVTDFIITGVNSAQRVAKFLMLQEMEKDPVNLLENQEGLPENIAIRIQNGSFNWSMEGQPVLEDISVQIPKGELVAVIGMVGSGKSSLLAAILGELMTVSGSVCKKGTIAYVPQEAWIQNDSIRNNILFGSSYRQADYAQVLQACALMADLSILPADDKTEIGEKGINLSGGQKQRVSLARAVYQDCDVYLLDDPLSAVDSHVGQHIFTQVIGKTGLLKGKTRVLITHGLQWLPYVDRILVLANGRLTEQGSLDQLMAHSGPFAHFISQYLLQQEQQQHQTADFNPSSSPQGDLRSASSLGVLSSSEIDQGEIFKRLLSVESYASETTQPSRVGSQWDLPDKAGALELSKMGSRDEGLEDSPDRLIEEEEMAQGRVSWSVYKSYFQSLGYLSTLMLVFLYMTFYGLDLAAGFWLTFWVDDPTLNNQTLAADSPDREQLNLFYLGIYSLWGVLQTILVGIFTTLKAWRHVHSCHLIHDKLITSVLASPIHFFDTTPVGRLLSRFSKDVSVIDTTLLMFLEIWVHAMLDIFCALLAITINMPVFLGAVVLVLILFYFIEKFYLPTSCQLRRLERKFLSPIFSHASETFTGTSVIRALGEESRFIRTADEKVDFCQKMKYASFACERWLSIRMGLLGDLLVLCTGLLVVTYRKELSPGLVGLCLTHIFIITNAMTLQVRMASFMEMDIVSVERILQYSTLTPEAALELSYPGLSSDWPKMGCISFHDVCVRYRPGLDLVLKNVTFEIFDGEKIGVVGRTGAGKSSLMLSLFRLIEPCQGHIKIDGIDISKLGLNQLRQKLAILPQDPVLFTGSLRSNFDPFGQFSEAEIWKCVEHCHLKYFVDTLPQGLDLPVGEGGSNLSIGQRQLVCLGRALLRKAQILVLDEATAAVDVQTDELIQQTIRSEFKSCTVLTIAHRLNTILDYDRILVLEHGQVVEFDRPKLLLETRGSVFSQMVAESQLVHRPTHDKCIDQHIISASPNT